MGGDGRTRTALTSCRAPSSGSGFVKCVDGGLSARRSDAPAGGIRLQTAGNGGPKSARSQRRQRVGKCPRSADTLAQRPQLVQGVGRSARTSHISRQSGCPGRDRPRGAPRPGLTCSCRRGQQSCGAAVAGAHLLRRSRARGGLSWCSTVGCPCGSAGGPAGGIERLLAAPSAISERPLHSRARQRRRRNARHLLRRFLCYKRACRTARGHGYGWLINLPRAAPQ